MSSTVITLEHPFSVGEEHHSTICVRRPKKRDLTAFDREKDLSKKSDLMLTTLTELPIDIIDELDVDDLAEVNKVVMGFMKKLADVAKDMTA